MDIKEKILQIQKQVNSNDFSSAIINCEKLIKKFPKNSYFFNLYGLVLQTSGKIESAIVYFEKAISLEQNNFAAMNNLANSYKTTFNFEKAEELYKKVLLEDPKNIKALNNYANLKKEFNKFSEAKKLLLKALEIETNNEDILSNLAICCQATGEIDASKKYAQKLLELDPLNTNAHKFMSSITNYKREPDHLIKMEKIIEDDKFKNFSQLKKINLFFALGKAYEDISDFKNSYNYLSKANLIIRRDSKYNLSNIRKLFESIIQFFEKLKIEDIKKNKSEIKNIFICGMPRSGTTLMEQIVASHSKVSGAGEVQYLEKIISKNFFKNNKFNIQEILTEMKKNENIVFEQYNKLLSLHEFNSKIITDKAPQNFIWIGFIKIFFPHSKIIHCSRDPKDNCLSLFKNYFPSKSMSWSYDQADIAEYYILYSKLMEFWKTKFSDFIFDAKYENIVNNPEVEVRKMMAFCDLDWEPECLNFHKNRKTPVQTISISQANKPIYKSSVNSYEPFADYLAEMFRIIDQRL